MSAPGIPDGYRWSSGQLTVGGIPLDRLAARVGGTPFFAYDRRLVTERVAQVRAALPEVHLRYAVKANPMPALLAHLGQLVDGFDVASALEMRHALDTGVPADRISFAGPGKTTAELSAAVAAGVTVEVESPGELERLRAVSEGLGIQASVAVRVNPDFAVTGSGMRMGGGPQQFGTDAERVPELLAAIGRYGLAFDGFHVFAGSQNLDAERICQAQRRTVELVVKLAAEAPGPVRHLNIGGGFGIPYFPKDRPLDLAPIGANLARLLDDVVRPLLGDAEVVVELGRYLVGEAGVYVTRVVDRKVSRGTTYLVVDGGMHHQLAASGNFGQVIRRNYPVAAGRLGDGEPETVTVVGSLCTPLDLLGKAVRLPRTGPGDLVVVFQAGAYGLTASPVRFLSHPEPVEVLV
ncbi:pyridoxal-dependent decarboxylase, exosortase A system-associated [Micromonospora sonchi]|uniref:Pyridoxal-dependent decarboxylase, exosortase A system-associated n=1 Tax=Micromonospora sonchi TaxID=1763543 RepID=A0A917TXI2_9ACTN|nr:pyridoxal-dependent decarboxylase, exosortase A system-associated [Micromonospora sonchi]GGM42579.1 pyridoxal-dependent decarboxylase, exosortase A system-associated [Micromonospora sonchi]